MNTTQKDTGNERRTPYHQGEAYTKGSAANKAAVIRSVLRMGHKVEVEVEEKRYPVVAVRSRIDFLELCYNSNGLKWVRFAPIFRHPGKTA